MTDLNLDELKHLAEEVLAEPLPVAKFNKRMVFQASADPATILALIARVRELEAAVRRSYMGSGLPWCSHCGQLHAPDCIVKTLPKEES